MSRAPKRGARTRDALAAPRAKREPVRVAKLRAKLDALRAPRRRVVASEQPVMLATLGDRPFSRPDWLFELKYDGVRVLAQRDAGTVELYGRAGQRFTPRYPEIVAALRALPLQYFVLDGEVVALDEGGRPSFQRLQTRMHLTSAADVAAARATTPVTAVFFDALALDGRDLRDLPLETRKALLAIALPDRGVAHASAHVVGHGEAFYDAASEQRVEGIVAKRASSPYTGGRSRDWIKIKCHLRQEFVIGGFTAPQGARARFGALHVGFYDGDTLVYAGRVGTGFDDAMLERLWHRLQALRCTTSPFRRGTPNGRGHTWVSPALVCEVRFTEWTLEGGIRHPAFLGMREDKAPLECRREGVEIATAASDSSARSREDAPSAAAGNVDKTFWPDDGYTKSDLLAYYDAIAPRLLPYLRDRPLVVTRYPDGIAGKAFHAPAAGRDVEYIVVDDAAALRDVIDLGVIPLHLWGARVASLDRPDWLILDLDPKGAPFRDVVAVARTLKAILDELGVVSSVKTSGATGLHVLVPMGARYTWEEVRTFARLLATLGVEAAPTIATIARQGGDRDGKVSIDWLRNVRGRTIVAPFAVRPLPGAPVSCPLRWEEVTPKLDPRAFTIATVPKRFRSMKDPMALVLGDGVDVARALRRLARGRRA